MNKRRNNLFNICSVMIITLLCLVWFSGSAFAADTWINQNTMWTEQGCTLNVKNKRTNKWTAAINYRTYENHVTWDSQINVGDELYIDAYTCFNGGKLWIYEDGICVTTIDAGTQEHIYYECTVRTTNMKITCSAAVNATTGEALSITILAGGDSTAPVASPVTPYCVVGQPESIHLTDNIGVTAFYVSTVSTVPSYRDAGWISITSSPDTTKTYTPTQAGMHYVFAKDAVNNISDMAHFEAGYLPVIPKPEDAAVKKGEQASFIGAPESGTAAFTYQWYRNVNNSNNDGNEVLIPGATSQTYTRTTVEEDNNTYYFVEVTSRFGSGRSPAAHLTVYFPHVLGTMADATVNLGQTHNFSVPIARDGETNNYTYQWYIANTSDPSTSNGTRITGATSRVYGAKAEENYIRYYYCEVTNRAPNGNALYTVTSNRAKLVADVTRPIINLEKISPEGTKYINKNATLEIEFLVVDTGEGYTENGNNFTGDDFEVLVNGEIQTGASCTVQHLSDSGNEHRYKLSLTGVTSNGELRLRVPLGSIVDHFGNINEDTVFAPEITVDNVAPILSEHLFIGGVNDVYANKEDKVSLEIVIDDNYGLKPEEFTADDITVRVNGANANADVEKTLTFDSIMENRYIYTLDISNIKGDGELSLFIASGRVKDWANNDNANTTFTVRTQAPAPVIIDNTAPVISELRATLDSFTSGLVYPNSLSSWKDNWSNRTIYVRVLATDTNGNHIDYYMTSRDAGENYDRLATNEDVISFEFNGNMYYRVYDMAGNYDTKSMQIKIDKTVPEATKMGIYELRDGGAEYVYDATIPSNKTLYVRALSTSDHGNIQSGIEEGITAKLGNAEGKNSEDEKLTVSDYIMIPQESPNNPYSTYFVIRKYRSLGKGTILQEWREVITANAIELKEDGYYEIQSTTTDNANNVKKSDIYRVYINKRSDNTIRVSNIMDIGSGVKSLTINVYRGSAAGGEADKAIETIYVENPYKEYVTTVRLGRGTFYAEAILEDNSGLVTIYSKVITNDF